MTAVRTALRRAAPGDLVVCCVDDAVGVYREAMARGRLDARGDGVRRPGRARGAGGLSAVAGLLAITRPADHERSAPGTR